MPAGTKMSQSLLLINQLIVTNDQSVDWYLAVNAQKSLILKWKQN
jgi:hypothetical protein